VVSTHEGVKRRCIFPESGIVQPVLLLQDKVDAFRVRGCKSVRVMKTRSTKIPAQTEQPTTTNGTTSPAEFRASVPKGSGPATFHLPITLNCQEWVWLASMSTRTASLSQRPLAATGIPEMKMKRDQPCNQSKSTINETDYYENSLAIKSP